VAWLKEILKYRCAHCRANATVVLMNRFNIPGGTFCRRCGRKALAEAERKEREEVPR